MKIKTAINTSLFLLIAHCAFSQHPARSFKSVNVGDKVPAYTFNNLINYQQGSKMTDFKGKLLIIDFWTVHCTACIKSWPKLLEIQKEFKDQVQLILANTESDKESIRRFIKNQERIHGYKMYLPVTCGDKRLKTLFPHQAVPHVIYIDKAGVVKYITNTVSKGIIESLLDNRAEPMKITEKKDNFAKITWSEPLFINGNVAKKDVGANVMYSSIISPFSPAMYGVMNFVNSRQNIRNGRSFGVIINSSLKVMFQFLYGREYNEYHWIYPVQNARILFRNLDTTKLVAYINGIPKDQNRYTIQVTAQNDFPITKMRKKMISDLEECFRLKTGWEKMREKCLIISRTKSPIDEYKGGKDLSQISETMFKVNNITVEELIDRISYRIPSFQKSAYPIVDETNFKGKLGNINLNTTDKIIDYKVLGKELLKHGLQFSIEERDVEMLVIGNSN